MKNLIGEILDLDRTPIYYKSSKTADSFLYFGSLDREFEKKQSKNKIIKLKEKKYEL